MQSLLLLLLCLLLPANAAFADDDQAYALTPPADSAFVRLVNAAGNQPINGLLGNLTFKETEGFSPYKTIKKGKYDISVDKTKKSIRLRGGKIYSLFYTRKHKKGVLTLMEDPLPDSSLAMIYFYNFSDQEAFLRAPNFNTDILSKVAAGTSQAKAFEALTLDVALTVDNLDIKTFPGIALAYKRGFSFLLTGSKGKYDGFWAMNHQSR